VMAILLADLMVMSFFVFLALQKGDALGGVNGGLPGEDILHEFFQSGAGENNQVCAFSLPDLIYIQGIVVQTGDRFRDQSPYGQAGSPAEAAGKFIDRQGRGGDIRSLRLPGAAGEKEKTEKKYSK